MGPHAAQFGLGDLRQGQEFVAHGLRRLAQAAFRGLTVDHQGDDLHPVDQLGDHRFFGLLGQGVDAVHFGLDVLQCHVRIYAGQQFHCDRAPAFHGLGGHFLDAFQAADVLLDDQEHAFLHLLGRGPGVDHADLDLVQSDLREDLLLDVQPDHQPADHEHEH